MKKAIIYHNPRCSKSRQTLQILNDKGVSVNVVEYLKTAPSIKELEFFCKSLKIRPLDIMRTKEALFKDLNLSKDDKRSTLEWLQLLHDYPSLIERPIVIYNGKVAIGRPPENVLAIL
jgi:arsenate reductase